MAEQWRDTIVGLARRTGPTTLELLTPDGKVYGFNYAEIGFTFGDRDPRHEVDDLFLGEHTS